MSKVLKNINIFAGKADPVLKADSAYPTWLFSLLEKSAAGPKPAEKYELHERLSVQYLRLQNRLRIKQVARSLKK
ncbi:hypothetical protein HDU83_001514 [Entophlyctis luteolus]|nr:hypothetical protein HDU82_009099 [Entophlyctis luteolus]KAJ3356307.1 hypothetical protein HDU83_001514 [Entophlyctis luteolus]KAJ3393051.1 hypothetical protein HDU84_002991 [Entophlyctis sp. JEL0112]